MSEWWTYRPSDFLLFAPSTYYRLIALHNEELWPAQAVAVAVALLAVALAWRGGRHAGRIVGGALAVAWIVVGWRFHWHHYATINWAASYFAAAFALQAALLGWVAATGGLAYGNGRRTQRYAGLALVVAALVLLPGISLALDRPWLQVEVAGVSPDPTALLTLGLLLIAQRPPLVLFVIPVPWCLLSTLTLWTMQAPDAWLPALGAAVALAGRAIGVASNARMKRAR